MHGHEKRCNLHSHQWCPRLSTGLCSADFLVNHIDVLERERERERERENSKGGYGEIGRLCILLTNLNLTHRISSIDRV